MANKPIKKTQKMLGPIFLIALVISLLIPQGSMLQSVAAHEGFLHPVNSTNSSQNINNTRSFNVGILSLIHLLNSPKLSQHTTSYQYHIPFLTQDPLSYESIKKKLDEQRTKTKSQSSASLASNIISQSQGFDGITQKQTMLFPPDVQIGSSPTQIVEVVNTAFEIWNRENMANSFAQLGSILPSGYNFDPLSDPKIVFDNSSQRWFISFVDLQLQNNPNNVAVIIGVSTQSQFSSNSANWHFYPVLYGTECPDQPKIGFSNDKFALGVNVFSSCSSAIFLGSQYLILDKNSMIQGSQNVHYQASNADISRFGIIPVKSLSSNTSLYLAAVDFAQNPLGTRVVHFYTITGTVPNASISQRDLVIGTIRIPPSAHQNGPNTIDTGDNRVQDASWFNGKLWFDLGSACNPSGDAMTFYSCIHLTQIDTNLSKVTQDFDVTKDGYDYFYPALTIDAIGGLDVIIGYSSPSSFPSLAITGQSPSDPLNTVENLQDLKIGSAPDTSSLDSIGCNCYRYGDYFGASLDPYNPSFAWMAGEYYSTSSGWSTFINQMSIENIASQPTGLRAIAVSSTQINLSWTTPTNSGGSPITGYKIERESPSGGGFTILNANTGLTATTYNDSGLFANTQYNYRVSAINSLGTSLSSNRASATTSSITPTNCLPPVSGVWTISSDCTLASTSTAQANVIVQSGAVLTIPNGLRLNIDLIHHHLLVNSGGGLLIKAGGEIN